MIGTDDRLDALLLATMADFRHERRMREIREMDVGQWAREVSSR